MNPARGAAKPLGFRPTAKRASSVSAGLLFAAASLGSGAAAAQERAPGSDDTAEAEQGGPPAPVAVRPAVPGWGDAAFYSVVRAGTLFVPRAERGASGALVGSGIEVRFTMPPGWGAYYRVTTGATNAKKGSDWDHLDVGAGVTGRVFATRLVGFWAPRASVHVDAGLLYTQLGTNERCTTGVAPFAASCSSVSPDRPTEASGAGIGLDLRLGGEVGIGPFAAGLDVGASGYRRWSTGGNSVSPPGWFALLAAQVRVGLSLPF